MLENIIPGKFHKITQCHKHLTLYFNSFPIYKLETGRDEFERRIKPDIYRTVTDDAHPSEIGKLSRNKLFLVLSILDKYENYPLNIPIVKLEIISNDIKGFCYIKTNEIKVLSENEEVEDFISNQNLFLEVMNWDTNIPYPQGLLNSIENNIEYLLEDIVKINSIGNLPDQKIHAISHLMHQVNIDSRMHVWYLMQKNTRNLIKLHKYVERLLIDTSLNYDDEKYRKAKLHPAFRYNQLCFYEEIS